MNKQNSNDILEIVILEKNSNLISSSGVEILESLLLKVNEVEQCEKKKR